MSTKKQIPLAHFVGKEAKRFWFADVVKPGLLSPEYTNYGKRADVLVLVSLEVSRQQKLRVERGAASVRLDPKEHFRALKTKAAELRNARKEREAAARRDALLGSLVAACETGDLIGALSHARALVKRNSYGDFISAHPSFVEGLKQIRCTEVVGWDRGYPKKQIVWYGHPAIAALEERLDLEQKAAKKAARKTLAAQKRAATKAAATAAGLSVAAFNAAEKVRHEEEKAQRRAAARAQAAAEYEADAALWLPVVEEVLDDRHYGFSADDAVLLVLQKIHDDEGVGAAWNRGEFGGGRHAFVRAVLGAAHRHENTDYDQYLRAGYDREDARAMAM